MNFIPKFEYEHPTLGTTTITLDLPPEGDPLKEKNKVNGKETRSGTGQDQFQFNYEDTEFQLKLVFVTKTILDQLRLMYDVHAKLGKTFKYFQSEDEVEFLDVIWSKKVFNPVRVIASGSDFIYDFTFDVRVKIA